MIRRRRCYKLLSEDRFRTDEIGPEEYLNTMHMIFGYKRGRGSQKRTAQREFLKLPAPAWFQNFGSPLSISPKKWTELHVSTNTAPPVCVRIVQLGPCY